MLLQTMYCPKKQSLLAENRRLHTSLVNKVEDVPQCCTLNNKIALGLADKLVDQLLKFQELPPCAVNPAGTGCCTNHKKPAVHSLAKLQLSWIKQSTNMEFNVNNLSAREELVKLREEAVATGERALEVAREAFEQEKKEVSEDNEFAAKELEKQGLELSKEWKRQKKQHGKLRALETAFEAKKNAWEADLEARRGDPLQVEDEDVHDEPPAKKKTNRDPKPGAQKDKKCPQCDKTFFEAWKRDAHVKHSHAYSANPVLCIYPTKKGNKCQFKHTSHKNFESHMRHSMHGLVLCGPCQGVQLSWPEAQRRPLGHPDAPLMTPIERDFHLLKEHKLILCNLKDGKRQGGGNTKVRLDQGHDCAVHKLCKCPGKVNKYYLHDEAKAHVCKK